MLTGQRPVTAMWVPVDPVDQSTGQPWTATSAPLGPTVSLCYPFGYTELGTRSNFSLIFELKLNPENPEIQINFEKSYKIIRNSDEKDLYMKNDQENETNPNMPSMFMSHLSNISNLQLLLSNN